MRRAAALGLAFTLVVAGCSKAEEKTDASTMLNPTGSAEKLPPQAQETAARASGAAAAASKNMDEASRQWKEAQARSGGK